MTIDLAANIDECAALAKALDIPAVAALTARLRITRAAKDQIHVTGEVAARLTQICVVSLDPFELEMREPVDVFFAAAPSEGRRGSAAAPREIVIDDGDEDPPEPIVNGRIDLGAIAYEFLALGLDPHPRKPGVAFEEILSPLEPAPAAFQLLARLIPKPPAGGGE